MMPLSVELSTACPASTYSIAIRCSLRTRLCRSVQARLGWRFPLHDDRGGQAAALVVARAGAVPVVAGAVELEGRGALRVVHQPDELVVTVARQHRAMGVLVIVD